MPKLDLTGCYLPSVTDRPQVPPTQLVVSGDGQVATGNGLSAVIFDWGKHVKHPDPAPAPPHDGRGPAAPWQALDPSVYSTFTQSGGTGGSGDSYVVDE